jgi:hypothetical protein
MAWLKRYGGETSRQSPIAARASVESISGTPATSRAVVDERRSVAAWVRAGRTPEAGRRVPMEPITLPARPRPNSRLVIRWPCARRFTSVASARAHAGRAFAPYLSSAAPRSNDLTSSNVISRRRTLSRKSAVPLPSTTGRTTSRYSSTKPLFISDCAMAMLPLDDHVFTVLLLLELRCLVRAAPGRNCDRPGLSWE